jgi:hypothetical protein
VSEPSIYEALEELQGYAILPPDIVENIRRVGTVTRLWISLVPPRAFVTYQGLHDEVGFLTVHPSDYPYPEEYRLWMMAMNVVWVKAEDVASYRHQHPEFGG